MPTFRLQRRTALRWLAAAGLVAVAGWFLVTRPLLSIALFVPLCWAAWKWRGYRRRLPASRRSLEAPHERLP